VAWDTESRADAYDQARDLALRDPDAASYLLAHLDSPDAADAPPRRSQAAYDPMALYARVMRFYKGAVSFTDCQNMHYITFFGLVREASLIAEEENRAAKAPPPVPDDPQTIERHF
jgi:hypothetical protein